MTLPSPSIEYFLLSPMFIVFGIAVLGVLVEAFLPRPLRYGAQLVLALGGLAAAFAAVVAVAKSVPAEGRRAVLGAVAVDRPTLFLQGTIVLVSVLAVIFVAERSQRTVPDKAAEKRKVFAGLDSFTPRRPRCPVATPSTRPNAPVWPRPNCSRC